MGAIVERATKKNNLDTVGIEPTAFRKDAYECIMQSGRATTAPSALTLAQMVYIHSVSHISAP